MNRRSIFACLMIAGSMTAYAGNSEWPNHPITIVVPSAPGAASDTVARVISQYLGDQLSVPVIVLNKPGAAGQIGTRLVAESAADGYTLLLASNAFNAGSEVLNAGKNPHPIASENAFTGVGVISWLPSTLVVSQRLKVKSWDDFKKLAQSQPDGLTYSTSNTGSAGHISFLLMNQEYGIKMRAIPYNGGGPAIQAAAAGEVDATIGPIQPMEELIKGGRLVPILELADQPGKVLPSLPTANSVGVEKANTTSWLALLVSARTPDALTGKLRTAFDKVKTNPKYNAELKKLGNPADPGQYQVPQLIRDEKAKILSTLKTASVN